MDSYKKFKQQLLRDKEIKNAYDELGSEFALVHMIIEKRNECGLTQAALAKKLGTKQSAISRLERGTYNPTVSFLQKLAVALGTKLTISFS